MTRLTSIIVKCRWNNVSWKPPCSVTHEHTCLTDRIITNYYTFNVISGNNHLFPTYILHNYYTTWNKTTIIGNQIGAFLLKVLLSREQKIPHIFTVILWHTSRTFQYINTNNQVGKSKDDSLNTRCMFYLKWYCNGCSNE